VIGDKQNTIYRSPITYHFDARALSCANTSGSRTPAHQPNPAGVVFRVSRFHFSTGRDVQRRDYPLEIWMSPLPKRQSRHAVKRDGSLRTAPFTWPT
jgi:hypothetical protein